MKTLNLSHKKVRGVSLIETLLALSIGGAVMTGSVFGITEYATGVKVQASSSMLERLSVAAEQYAQDNYGDLVSGGPREIAISVLEPYFGHNIASDAFKNNFLLTSRTYTITVLDPVNGGTMEEDAVQLLVVAKMPDDGVGGVMSDLDDNPLLRAEVVNGTGASAGFIATSQMSCLDASGAADRPAGHICGAFGSFSFGPEEFPATDFSDVAYVALVGAGDQSIYGDQLYRYDLGDPDLNTMSTDLFMAGNNIVNPNEIQDVDRVTFAGPNRTIDSRDASSITIAPGGVLRLEPGQNQVIITDQGGVNNPPILTGDANRLQLTTNDGRVALGGWREDINGSSIRETGASDLFARQINTDRVLVNSVNSLHERTDDALRLQNIDNGETIFGKRVLYNPDGAGSIYEIADGDIRAQHAVVQDITCADCGGTLSQILPKWRHMGTYLIQDLISSPSGTIIPKPQCTQTKRNPATRSPVGDNPGYLETPDDTRFTAKIVMIPKQIALGTAGDAQIRFNFYAQDSGTNWIAFPSVRSSIPGFSGGIAEALAMTYCVFTGGDSDPASAVASNFQQADVPGRWSRRD